MAVIKDIKELPKDEPKLQKYTIYCLLVCLLMTIIMAVWYLIRMNHSGDNDSDPSWLWSFIHLVSYIAYAVVTGLGLFGAYSPKPQFLLWFLFGSLAIIIAEVVCIFWNQVVVGNQNKKYSIIVVIIKVLAIVVFIASAVLAFLWKRLLDRQSSKPMQIPDKNGQKVDAVKDDPKNGPKNEAKTDKIKSKA